MPYVDDFMFINFLIIGTPFIIWGMWSFSTWITTLIKVRRGFMEVRWIEKNHQEKVKLQKPQSNNIKIDGKPYPFINSPDFYVMKGAKKILEFTRLGERLQQIRFAGTIKRNEDEPSEDLFNSMLMEAEQWGKLQVFKPDILMKLLTIIAAVGVIAIGAGLVIELGMLNNLPQTTASALGESLKDLPTQVADKITPLISKPVIPNATVIP